MKPEGSGGRAREAVRRYALDISPLRESPAYRALWLGQVVSLVGTQMRIVAVSFQIFELTGSSVAVGLLGLIEVVPSIGFSIVGGTVADRVDRRKVMAVAQVGLMLTSILLAVLSFAGGITVLWIYAISALASAVQSFDRPARTSMTPHLVRPGLIPAALALRQVVFQVTQIVGPLIGGVLIATLSGDVGWVYALDAVSFTAALIALRWVPSIEVVAVHESPIRAMKEGLRYAARTPLILSILLIDLIAMVFGMPRAVFPELADETYAAGAGILGLLYAAPSVGALIAALTTGWVGRIRRQGRAVVVAVSVWGLAITAAGVVVTSLPLVLVLLAVAGAADVISAVFRGTMLTLSTPDELRGRVSSINLMVVTGGPRLGDFEAGLLAGAIGPQGSVIAGGIACLAGTAILARTVPALDRYEAKETA